MRLFYEDRAISADFAHPQDGDVANLREVWIARINVGGFDESDSIDAEAQVTAVCLAELPDGLDEAI